MARALILLLSILVFWGSSSSLAAENCESVFKNSSYIEQVISTKGTRLFIKESEKDTAEKRWLGLVRRIPQEELSRSWKVSKYLRYIIKSLPLKLFGFNDYKNYELTPFKAVYENTVIHPSHWFSQKLGHRKMEPAFFVRFPIAIALSLASWSHIDAYYAEKVSQQIDQNISTYSETYKQLIDNDFRYRQIKADLDKHLISERQALVRAYWENTAYEEYFNYLESNGNSVMNLKAEEKLLGHFAFNHLQSVFKDGVTEKEGFLVSKERIGPISEAQKIELFKLNHALNLRYQLIADSVKNTEAYSRIQSDPEIQRLMGLSLSTPFSKELFNLRQLNKISDQELIKFLQEDAYWQTRIAEWSVIGVSKLKKKNGFYEDAVLKIEDIQIEILQEIYAKLR